jgi:ferredoxin
MSMRPVIDPYACAAHGDCVDELPEAFALDGDVATVVGPGPDARLMAAARACPASAISLVDADTGAHIYP